MEDFFDRFKGLKVLVIGDVMTDSYLWGYSDRISPEAPVPILTVTKKENRPGGAANVALNIRSLGAMPFLCSVVGEDAEGTAFLAMMAENGLSTEGIIRSSTRQTTVKTRVIAHNQQIVRIDNETTSPLNGPDTDSLSERISKLLTEKNADAVIFQDYDKGVITEELIWQVNTFASMKNMIVAVDPKKRNFLSYHNVTLFKPNLKELREGLKMDIDARNPVEIERAAAALQEQIRAKMLMITLSEHGIYVASGNGNKMIPAHIRTISDVSGAGDTVIATATLCLAAGLDEFKAAAIANLAGGLVCELSGVVPVNFDTLLNESRIVG